MRQGVANDSSELLILLRRSNPLLLLAMAFFDLLDELIDDFLTSRAVCLPYFAACVLTRATPAFILACGCLLVDQLCEVAQALLVGKRLLNFGNLLVVDYVSEGDPVQSHAFIAVIREGVHSFLDVKESARHLESDALMVARQTVEESCKLDIGELDATLLLLQLEAL